MHGFESQTLVDWLLVLASPYLGNPLQKSPRIAPPSTSLLAGPILAKPPECTRPHTIFLYSSFPRLTPVLTFSIRFEPSLSSRDFRFACGYDETPFDSQAKLDRPRTQHFYFILRLPSCMCACFFYFKISPIFSSILSAGWEKRRTFFVVSPRRLRIRLRHHLRHTFRALEFFPCGYFCNQSVSIGLFLSSASLHRSLRGGSRVSFIAIIRH